MHFLFLYIFFKNGSPEQTTMLMRRAAKFCVEPRSPFSEIFHQESKTLGKRLHVVSWPECQPEFPSDGGDGDGVPTTLPIWSSPWAITPRDQISRAGNPSLRQFLHRKMLKVQRPRQHGVFEHGWFFPCMYFLPDICGRPSTVLHDLFPDVSGWRSIHHICSERLGAW